MLSVKLLFKDVLIVDYDGLANACYVCFTTDVC